MKANELSTKSKNLINKIVVEAHLWGQRSDDLTATNTPQARYTLETAAMLREHVRGLERNIAKLEKSAAKMRRQLDILTAGEDPGEIRELPRV